VPIFKSFAANTPPLLDKMAACLDSSLPDYAIEAHGLKGACGAVCADGTTVLAKDLEAASKAGDLDYVRSRHGELRRRALLVAEGLKTLLAEWEAGRPAKEREPRPKPDRELLARLSAVAGEMDASSVEAILQELERYRYEKEEGLVVWLRERAENFEYEAIHQRLREREDWGPAAEPFPPPFTPPV
jgi:hypothetical protein